MTSETLSLVLFGLVGAAIASVGVKTGKKQNEKKVKAYYEAMQEMHASNKDLMHRAREERAARNAAEMRSLYWQCCVQNVSVEASVRVLQRWKTVMEEPDRERLATDIQAFIDELQREWS